MDIMTCPHCHRKADRPLFLPRAQQQIFDFIWNNPGCSRATIEYSLYGRHSENLVLVQISKIRNNLTGTPYKLESRNDPNYIGVGRCPSKIYTIVEALPK